VTYEITLVLGVMLVAVTFVALMIRRLVWSLIMLFYSSIVFGLLLMSYGATFAGLFHIITFAGAVSVLFMVILMIVGGQALSYTDKPGKENFFGNDTCSFSCNPAPNTRLKLPTAPERNERASATFGAGHSAR
jgi:hypothetical protein